MGFFRRLMGAFGTDDNDGETPEFKAFLKQSMEGLRSLTQSHQVIWGFGKEERWDFNQETGLLVFTFPDKVATTSAQIIGTFDSQQGTWMWGWANPTIEGPILRDSFVVRKYGQEHTIRRLTTHKWAGTESDGWDMAALATRLCESNGVYRGPAGTTLVFMTFGEVQISKKT